MVGRERLELPMRLYISMTYQAFCNVVTSFKMDQVTWRHSKEKPAGLHRRALDKTSTEKITYQTGYRSFAPVALRADKSSS